MTCHDVWHEEDEEGADNYENDDNDDEDEEEGASGWFEASPPASPQKRTLTGASAIFQLARREIHRRSL